MPSIRLLSASLLAIAPFVVAPGEPSAYYSLKWSQCVMKCPVLPGYSERTVYDVVAPGFTQVRVEPSHYPSTGCGITRWSNERAEYVKTPTCSIEGSSYGLRGIDKTCEVCWPIAQSSHDTFVDACCTRSLCMKSIMGFAPKQNRHFDPPNVFARVRCMIGAPPCHRVPERGLEIPCQFVSPEDREVPFCSVRDFYT